jgi:K+-transporting ATPase ATPase C chain
VNVLRPALVSLAALTLLGGAAYPLLVTAVARVASGDPTPTPPQGGARNGGEQRAERSRRSLARESPVGQPFTDPRYFWGRPSATAPFPYNAGASAGANLGPGNPALARAVEERIAALRAADPEAVGPVPVDLVTASASGLDPHISPAAAAFQVRRVARARGLDEARVRALVAAHTEGRTLGFLGEPRVHVLALNLALDELDHDVRAP